MIDDAAVERRRAEYITAGEFGRTMALLEEIRTDIKAGQEQIRQELFGVGKRITDRQDTTNGRLLKAEGELVATVRDLKILETKAADYRDARAQERVDELAVVAKIKSEMDVLMKKGCAVRQEHASDIETLRQAGVLDAVAQPAWKRTAPAVGIGLGGMGLGLVTPHLGQVIHWLISFLPVVK